MKYEVWEEVEGHGRMRNRTYDRKEDAERFLRWNRHTVDPTVVGYRTWIAEVDENDNDNDGALPGAHRVNRGVGTVVAR